MRALTVEPGRADSAQLDKVPEPPLEDGAVLVRTLAVGICGTDAEIVAGGYGAAPAGRSRLILGHESLGRVEAAPVDCGLAAGDLVVGIVRRPDPEPCRYCAAGEWDMCANGRYTERGIKGLNGYGSDYFRIEPEFAVRIDPALGLAGVLLEPASIVTKAWEHAERIGRRSAAWQPRTVLVTGAGPIGLLAALLGAQRGLEVHVLDRATTGPKPQLVRDLGAIYHAGRLPQADAFRPDMVFECTGAPALVLDAIRRSGSPGIVCLAGLSSGQHEFNLDLAALNRSLVLENDAVFGAVNANRSHYEKAAAALGAADRSWLARLISRRVAPEHWAEALRKQPDDVKVVLDFTQ
ncbi:glucose 1-dehydrogenase [Variovorax paradoxus]|nr:glucose 1-dehydrogenase [Variovorax paradoxus]